MGKSLTLYAGDLFHRLQSIFAVAGGFSKSDIIHDESTIVLLMTSFKPKISSWSPRAACFEELLPFLQGRLVMRIGASSGTRDKRLRQVTTPSCVHLSYSLNSLRGVK